MKIAIMQPYFVPYAGYFRLLTMSDLFVIYDCVQFPRRGWVHRNQVLSGNAQKKWLTLPIAKCPQNTLIQDLKFDPEASILWEKRLSGMSHFSEQNFITQKIHSLFEHLVTLTTDATEYIENVLKSICTCLGITTPIIRSSTLNVAAEIKGQDRIMEICRLLKATDYINSPGGRTLYDPETFAHHNIKLHFLKPYEGNSLSILQQLLMEKKEDIRDEIHRQSLFA